MEDVDYTATDLSFKSKILRGFSSSLIPYPMYLTFDAGTAVKTMQE